MIPFLLLVKKELALDSRYPVPLLQSLVISPLVTAVPLLLVYRSVLTTSASQIGGWTQSTYLAHMGVGLVCHFCLNSGVYVLFNRLHSEWHQHTFALLWLSPLPRLFNLLAISFSDVARAFVVSGVLLLLLSLQQASFFSLFTALTWFGLFFLFGAGLGILRFLMHILAPASFDLVNFIYLALLFSSGLYFPAKVLPEVLKPLAQFNPLLHGKAVILGGLLGKGSVADAVLFLGPLCLLWSGVVAFVWWATPQITEACLKN